LNQLPGVQFLELPGYEIRYASQPKQLIAKLLFQLPRVLLTIRQEHRKVDAYIREYQFDLIISDNRYGAWSPLIPSWFITHQLNIQVPFSTLVHSFVNRVIHRWVRRFDFCWIPDYPEHLLSGALSESLHPLPTGFLGPLSHLPPTTPSSVSHDILILLSGPEPQRSILEELIWPQLIRMPGRHTLIRGTTNEFFQTRIPDHIKVFDLAHAAIISNSIADHKYIVCRSGYSTLMDLVCCNKRALLVPTPGQTEQEYLAEHFASRFGFARVLQDQIDLEADLSRFDQVPNKPIPVWNEHGVASFLRRIDELGGKR